MRPGIQEHIEISTEKKGPQSENEDGYELIWCTYSQTLIFFDFLKKEEMRSGTHFTQQKCFCLAGNSFGVSYIWYLLYNTVVRLLKKSSIGGNQYLDYL